MQFLFVYTVEWQEANIINIDVCWVPKYLESMDRYPRKESEKHAE